MDSNLGVVLNVVFTVLMLILAWVDLKTFKTQNHRDFKSIIMSMGVLGTFVGIFVGLMGFNASNVEESIPILLEGLKVAFYTSIAGMGIAIMLAIIQKLKSTKSNFTNSTEYFMHQAQNLDTLIYLQELQKLDSLLQIQTQIQENISAQKNTEQNRLDIQVQHFNMLENILANGFENVQKDLKQAVSELAKGASEGLIDALSSVIKDFNTRLSEQFGNNFKEFNEAIEKMLVWQRDYQETINKSQEILREVFELMQSTASTLDSIAQRNQEVMSFYNDLKIFLEETKNTSQDIQESLKPLSILKDDAKESIVCVKNLFENALNNMNILSQVLRTAFGESEKILEQRIEHLQQDAHEALKNLNQNLNAHSEILHNHISDNSNTLKESFVHLGEHFKQFSKSLNGEITDMYENAHSQMKQNSMIFTQSIENQSKNFKESIDTLQQVGEKSFVNLKEDIHNMYELGSKQLEGIAQKNTQFFEDSLVQSKKYLHEKNTLLQELFTGNIEQLSRNFKQISADVTSCIQTLQEQVKESNEHSRMIFAEHQKFMEEQQRITKEGVVAGANAMVKQNRSFLEGIGTQTKDFFTQSLKLWQNDQKEALNKIIDDHKRVTQSFEQLTQTFFSNLTSLSNGLHSGINEVKDSLKKMLHDLVLDLKEGSEKYNSNSLAIMESNIAHISQKIVSLQELSHRSMDVVAQEYLAQFKKLMDDSIHVPQEASMKILNEIEQLQKGIAANILTTNQGIASNKEEVRMIIENINTHIQNQLNSTQQVNESLCDSLQKLDKSLAELTKGFKSDYEWFLRRISDFMGTYRN